MKKAIVFCLGLICLLGNNAGAAGRIYRNEVDLARAAGDFRYAIAMYCTSLGMTPNGELADLRPCMNLSDNILVEVRRVIRIDASAQGNQDEIQKRIQAGCDVYEKGIAKAQGSAHSQDAQNQAGTKASNDALLKDGTANNDKMLADMDKHSKELEQEKLAQKMAEEQAKKLQAQIDLRLEKILDWNDKVSAVDPEHRCSDTAPETREIETLYKLQGNASGKVLLAIYDRLIVQYEKLYARCNQP